MREPQPRAQKHKSQKSKSKDPKSKSKSKSKKPESYKNAPIIYNIETINTYYLWINI